jgi:hypothetical protein
MRLNEDQRTCVGKWRSKPGGGSLGCILHLAACAAGECSCILVTLVGHLSVILILHTHFLLFIHKFTIHPQMSELYQHQFSSFIEKVSYGIWGQSPENAHFVRLFYLWEIKVKGDYLCVCVCWWDGGFLGGARSNECFGGMWNDHLALRWIIRMNEPLELQV